MIEVSQLSYSYADKSILQEIGFKVNNGKVYGIFGDAGCGKSTLMALLSGGLPLQKGDIRINGFDLEQEEVSAKRCIGFLPQKAPFYSNMTVFELLDFVAEARGIAAERRFLQIHQTIEQFGLEEKRNCLISALQKAELRRLGLAQACIGNPEILLLDDLTDGLSRTQAEALFEYALELAEHGKTIFYASSDPFEIAKLCDEVMLLEDGKLHPPTPIGELLSGVTLRLTAKGDPNAIIEKLSEIDLLLACRKQSISDDGCVLLLRAADHLSEGRLSLAVSQANGELLSLEEEPLRKTEILLRKAATDNRDNLQIQHTNTKEESNT